jgi:hypothetical protein
LRVTVLTLLGTFTVLGALFALLKYGDEIDLHGAGADNLIFPAVILIGFGGYFLPAIIAVIRHHDNTTAIVLLNLFLGWTLIGWVAELVWSVTGNTGSRKCPFCAESMRPEATVCMHCGRDLPTAQPVKRPPAF